MIHSEDYIDGLFEIDMPKGEDEAFEYAVRLSLASKATALEQFARTFRKDEDGEGSQWFNMAIEMALYDAANIRSILADDE